MRTLLNLVVFMLLMQGCTQSVGNLEKREERDPILKRARAMVKAGDVNEAATLYQKALDRRPELARAHLELALLNDKYLENYLRAIYHYERYIELRPDAQKKDMIEELIRYARISYAATLPDQTSEAVEAIAELRDEIARLKSELARQSTEQRERPTPPAPKTVAPEKPPVVVAAATAHSLPKAPVVSPARKAVKTYQVREGDTLSKIASRVYDDPLKWKLIFDANRSALSSPESLRLNQELVIPSI